MLTKLMGSPISWTILSLITIFSLLYAIYCQHKNKERKEFSYFLKSSTLIERKKSKFEKLSITYNEQEIEDLCVSRFTIWNSGNRTLNRTDIVESRELSICASGDNDILDVELIACSETTNEFSIELVDHHCAKITFEYADKLDGVVVQIIHTGTTQDLSIDCKIKGGNPIKELVNEAVPKTLKKVLSPRKAEKVAVIASIALIATTIIATVFYAISIFNPHLQNALFSTPASTIDSTQKQQTYTIIMASMFLLYSVMTCILYTPAIKRYFKVGIPKALKKHANFRTDD